MASPLAEGSGKRESALPFFFQQLQLKFCIKRNYSIALFVTLLDLFGAVSHFFVVEFCKKIFSFGPLQVSTGVRYMYRYVDRYYVFVLTYEGMLLISRSLLII